MHICSGGFMLLTPCCTSRISCCWLLVNYTSWRVLTIWTFSVDVDGGRYLRMSLYVRPANNLSWRLAIPCRSAAFVGEHKLWWWYFANSSMLVVDVRLPVISVVAYWIYAIVHCWWWFGRRLVGRINGWVGWLIIVSRMADAPWIIMDPSTASGSIHANLV